MENLNEIKNHFLKITENYYITNVCNFEEVLCVCVIEKYKIINNFWEFVALILGGKRGFRVKVV
jgi:hypothetical protein